MAEVTLVVFGSLGDLHPMLGVGLALKQQGVSVTVATQPDYRDKVLNTGLAFFPVRLSFAYHPQRRGVKLPEFTRRMASDSGFIYKNIIGPQLSQAVEDLRPQVRRSDVVMATSVAFHAQIATVLERKPFTVAHLSPGVMFSAYDPLTSPEAPFISNPGPGGRAFNRLLLAMGGIKIGPAMAAIRRTYGDFGVTPDLRFVVLKSDLLTLGLYSPLLGSVQPDHPANLVVTGFPFYDSEDGHTPVVDPRLHDFLDEGEAPLVFSLGSAAVFDGERYFRTAIRVANRLKRRAVILSGSGSPLLNEDFGAGVHVAAYAPHSLVFPRASIVVHHGGIGSVGQSLMSGRPQLITPVFSDQFDNARRVQSLGAGVPLNASRWTEGAATKRLRGILASAEIHNRARNMAEAIAREAGSAKAATELVRLLRSSA